MTSLVLLLISCALCRYFPSEYDLTLLPSTNACDFAIHDEGVCGASWRYALSSTLQNIFCIQGVTKEAFSPQQLLSCAPNSSCQHFHSADQLLVALEFVKSHGLTTESCYPDRSNLETLPAKCRTSCVSPDSEMPLFKADYEQLAGADQETQIKDRLMTTGPVLMLYRNHQ